MHYYLIADLRESFESYYLNGMNDTKYNDHPSKRNINEIISNINSLGFECSYFGGVPELVNAVNSHSIFSNSAFINFSDGMNQEYSRAQVPMLLDILGTPYSGSGVFASVLMNNKFFCKRALLNLGLEITKDCLINHILPFCEESIAELSFPLFIKPNCEGSSLGISEDNICFCMEDVKRNIRRLLASYNELILEEFLDGIDVTNYLIGNNDKYPINDVVTAVLHSKSKTPIYGPTEKHNKLRTLYYNEEYLPTNVVNEIQNRSKKIANAIGAMDICRIDYRYNTKDGKIHFIEANSAPRFSDTSEIGYIARKRGMSFREMVGIYIDTFNKRVFY